MYDRAPAHATLAGKPVFALDQQMRIQIGQEVRHAVNQRGVQREGNYTHSIHL
jgi:hypothetical protein